VKATRRQLVVSSSSRGEAEFLFSKRIEAEVKQREDTFSFYTWREIQKIIYLFWREKK
jgi:hypothetical protein